MPRHRKLVVDELLTKPSAVVPTLFVGLGGCGCRMLVRVAEHLRRRPDYAERYEGLIKFALVDTNVNDLESFREMADETFLISDFEKEEYASLASGKLFLEPDRYFTQWVPQHYRFRSGDTAGAGQIRIESRLALYYQMKHKHMVPRFRKLLESMKSHEHGHRRLDSAELRIVLCFSVAGGTGSGANLPLAYMLRAQAEDLGQPRVFGVAVLPAVYEDKTGVNKDGTFANGYAALKEIEHLMKLGAPDSIFFPEEGLEFHYDPSDEADRFVRLRPYEFLYLIDKPESFSVSEPVDAAADGLYLQLFSPLFAEQIGDYDNYTQHQRFLVPHDFEGKGIQGFTTFYGSYGAAVLLVPAPGLVEYCSEASAISLMEASFLGDVPGDPAYRALRTNPDPFYEVTLREGRNEKPVHVSEFGRKERVDRAKLRDRLFLKRVRLLAACEQGEQIAGRFLTIFRHGHLPGEAPRVDGATEHRPDLEQGHRSQLSDARMRFSIGSIVLDALVGERGAGVPGLLQRALEAIEDHAAANPVSARGDRLVAEWLNQSAGWMDEYRSVGEHVLRHGYGGGTLRFPGLDELVDLQFLKGEAAEVELAGMRYAVLSLLEHVDWDRPAPERMADFDLGGRDRNERIKEKHADPLVQSLVQHAKDWAMNAIERAFVEALGQLKTNLDRFARVQRELEQGFVQRALDHRKRLGILSSHGDSSANEYVLDGEALQMENGRRLWDFYHEDQVAELPELSLGDRRVQRLLAHTVTDLSLTGSRSTTSTLDELFTALRDHARRVLHARICGDPNSPDAELRTGLTLRDALELELVYRSLFLSNADEVARDGTKAVQRLVAEYRALPPERRVDLRDPTQLDYTRDKIRRLVTEKASLLCVYDESRDQHGGVRPDRVFLAAIDESFRGSPIEEALQGLDLPRLKWVTRGWTDPQRIVFYRAVLNVPPYVFGRLDEMRRDYHRFKRMAKRSKVLHIDKNWEEALPDLDPVHSQEAHRQALVRRHIIHFAALLTTLDPQVGASYVIHREGRYLLRDPNNLLGERGLGLGADGVAGLGRTMAEAVERLPEVLEAERVKYLPYQQLLIGVREGLAPKVLARIVDLPFAWRQNRDELRTQYGSSPSVEQAAKLSDYTDGFRRLHEALTDLLEVLRNKEIERKTVGESVDAAGFGLSPADALRSLRQSIDLLAGFAERWQVLENPEQSRTLPTVFHALFKPLDEDDLATNLEHLSSGFGAQHAVRGVAAQPAQPARPKGGPRPPRGGPGASGDGER